MGISESKKDGSADSIFALHYVKHVTGVLPILILVTVWIVLDQLVIGLPFEDL